MSLRDRPPLRPRTHKSAEVRAVLDEVLRRPGWLLVKGGHWGLLLCEPGCHVIGVDSTPRSPGAHARAIRREAETCPLLELDPRSRRR